MSKEPTSRRGFLGLLGGAVLVAAVKPSEAFAKVTLPNKPVTHAKMENLGDVYNYEELGANKGLFEDYGYPLEGQWTSSEGVVIAYKQNPIKSKNPCDVYAIPEDCSANRDLSLPAAKRALDEFSDWAENISDGKISFVSTYIQDRATRSCNTPESGGDGTSSGSGSESQGVGTGSSDAYGDAAPVIGGPKPPTAFG